MQIAVCFLEPRVLSLRISSYTLNHLIIDNYNWLMRERHAVN